MQHWVLFSRVRIISGPNESRKGEIVGTTNTRGVYTIKLDNGVVTTEPGTNLEKA